MARIVAEELTDDMFRRLSGTDLESFADKALLLVTVDPEGWPHAAMLSYFEVVAKDRRTVRIATYTGSRTTGNMRRDGRVTIVLIDAGLACFIKGSAEELAPSMRSAPHNAKLSVTVRHLLVDEPHPATEPGAQVVEGIRYFSPDRDAALARARAVLGELLE